MRSYPLLVDGVEESGSGWTYLPDAASWIDDPEATLTWKRELELGRRQLGEDDLDRLAGRCAWGGIDECDRAVAAATRASSEFRRFPLKERLRFGAEVHSAIQMRLDEFVDVLVAEGHPQVLARWELSGVLSYLSPETLSWLAGQMEQEISWGGRMLRIVRKADGVVCVNPPQNAAASNSAMAVAAMLAGNTVVVKAPRSTPLGVMYFFHEIVRPVAEKCGVPAGALNVISGSSRLIMKSWVRNPRVDSILFFGESRTGLQVGRDCMANGKKAVLELSGNDGLVVWKDADLEGAADALLECFYGSSQICMVPKYAIVHPDVEAKLLSALLSRVKALAPGYPADAETLLTPVFKASRFFEMLSEARSRGAELLCGGERVDVRGTPSHKGLFIEATVVRVPGLELAEELACVREETFFPLLSIVVPQNGEDAELLDRILTFMNANRYGLRNSLWAQDAETIERFVRSIHNGGIIKVNDSHIGFVPYLATHGGAQQTGGPYGEMNYPTLRLSRLQGIAIGQDRSPGPLFERGRGPG